MLVFDVTFIAVLVFFSSFVLRLPAVFPNTPDFDFYGHAYYSKLIKVQKSGPFGPIQFNVLGAKAYYAPMLWNFLVSRIPYRILLRIQNVLNPLLEALFLSMLFFFAPQLGLAIPEALLLIALLFFTPALFTRISNGPRLQSFTPRLTGEVLTSIFFLLEIARIQLGMEMLFLLQVAVATMAVMASKFGPQALGLISFTYFGLSLSAFPIAAFFAALGFCAVLFPKQSIKAWGVQIAHLSEISRRTRHKIFETTKTKTLRDLLSEFPKKAFFSSLLKNYWPTKILFGFPLVFGSLFLHAYTGQPLIGNVAAEIAISGLIVFGLTSLPVGRFLGHPERYLTHIAPVFAYLAVSTPQSSPTNTILFVLILYGALFFLAETLSFSVLFGHFAEKREQERKSIIDHLSVDKSESLVVLYPFYGGPGTWRVLLETNHQVLDDLVNPAVSGAPLEFFAEYPNIDLDKLKVLESKHGLKWVVMGSREYDKLSTARQQLFENWSETRTSNGGSIIFGRF